MSSKNRGFYSVGAQEYPTPSIMHHLFKDSLSSTHSWERQCSRRPRLVPANILHTQLSVFRPPPLCLRRAMIADRRVRRRRRLTTPPLPWTPDDYATVAAAPVTIVSQYQQQPQCSQVPGVALYESQDFQQDDMYGPPLRPPGSIESHPQGIL